MFNMFQAQQPQGPQVIDPRAQYEQQSLLADTMLQNAQQYQGGGALGALAMIANAYGANKMGDRAQGSLSSVLEQEEARRTAEEKSRMAEEDRRFKQDLSARRQMMQERHALENKGRLSPEEEDARALALYEAKQGIDAQYAPEPEARKPTQMDIAASRIQQLVERGDMTPEQGDTALNNLLNIDASDPNDPEQNVSEGQRKEQQAMEAVTNSIANYRSLLEEHGTELFGKDSNVLQTAYNDALLKVKEAENLGVLSGPDVGIVQGVIGKDPTNIGAFLNPMGGRNRIARLDQYLQNRNPGQQPQQEQNGSQVSPETQALLERY